MLDEIYTTSLVLQVKLDAFDQVCHDLNKLAGTHFGHLEPSMGKIIVLLESNDMKDIHNWIDNARDIAGVFSVSMIYQHAENASSLNEVIA